MSKSGETHGFTLFSDQPNFTKDSKALPSFISPVGLLANDLKLFTTIVGYIPGIILPLHPTLSGKLDELSLNSGNIGDIIFHVVLIISQLAFILSLPFWIFMPFGVWVLLFLGFVLLNYLICVPFNGGRSDRLYKASPEAGIPLAGKGEKWIFLNGVSVGSHWLQNNLQRLANTFRREVIGVHNPTSGIVFDLIQCLIERDFSYNTGDIRQAYQMVKDQLMEPSNSKVVLIGHSQGGIEASMIVDWLLYDLSDYHLSKLEVYTFGCAANHFNNPIRHMTETRSGQVEITRALKHVEHYANNGDFVAQFGVLNYAKKTGNQTENRFVGRVFERTGSGHMFCQHYLDSMFVMDELRVAENNKFMDSNVKIDMKNTNSKSAQRFVNRPMKSLSRLWEYRNGKVPAS